MNVRRLLFLFSSMFLPLCTVWAQQETLTVDPAKSEVHFSLSDPLHGVHGSFQVQSGTIAFDQKDGRMSGTVVVDAASGNSGNSSRDKKMTEDELKAPNFHTVTFAPKRYSGSLAAAGDSTITVDGTFTLLGTPHEISVPMQVHLEGSQLKATGTFAIPYVKWGLKDPSSFVLRVGKEVTVDLVLAGSVASGHFD